MLVQITSVLDGGTVYSNSPTTLASLRAWEGGRMRTLPVFRQQGLQDLLPLALDNPDEGCIRPTKVSMDKPNTMLSCLRVRQDVFCFKTGDPRVNEQTVLCILHTLFIRQLHTLHINS